MNRELEIFEEKLKFRSQSTDTHIVSVDFFISHILPQVQVHGIISPSQVIQHEFSDFLVLYTSLETFDKTRSEGNTNSSTKVPDSVIFYGIGTPSKKYCGPPVEEHKDILHYQAINLNPEEKEWLWKPQKKEWNVTLREEEVIQRIRDAQEDEDRRVQCQNMTVEEIVTSMSREFSDGWLWVLDSYIDHILHHKKEDITRLIPFLRGENDSDNLYPYQKSIDNLEYFAVAYYYHCFYSRIQWDIPIPPQSYDTDFKNGARHANNIQIQRLRQVRQGELLLIDFLKMVIQEAKTIVQIREEIGKEFLFIPKILTSEDIEKDPQLITLIFDDFDLPAPSKYLQQFKNGLNIHHLLDNGKTVSLDTLTVQILPQMVILQRLTLEGADKIEHMKIVAIGKAEYKDLLEGKLRDTIVFQTVVNNRNTGQFGDLESFYYYISPLSDHISNMRFPNSNYCKLYKVEEVNDWIRQMQNDLKISQKRNDHFTRLFKETSVPTLFLEEFFEATTLSEDIKARAAAQNKTYFESITAKEWPQVTKEVKAQAQDFMKYLLHNKEIDSQVILEDPYENKIDPRYPRFIGSILCHISLAILQQLRERKEDYLQRRGIHENQLTGEDWDEICDFPVEMLQRERERKNREKVEDEEWDGGWLRS
ncbi:MAG: hypothetical protein ACXADY_13085 [Candidatus Hodarchaeales archaeon]